MKPQLPLGPMNPLTAPYAVAKGTLCDVGNVDVVFTLNGGTAPYKFDGVNVVGNTITKTVNLSLGTQTFTITDANTCTGSTTVSPGCATRFAGYCTSAGLYRFRMLQLKLKTRGTILRRYEYRLNGVGYMDNKHTYLAGLENQYNIYRSGSGHHNHELLQRPRLFETMGISIPEMPDG